MVWTPHYARWVWTLRCWITIPSTTTHPHSHCLFVWSVPSCVSPTWPRDAKCSVSSWKIMCPWAPRLIALLLKSRLMCLNPMFIFAAVIRFGTVRISLTVKTMRFSCRLRLRKLGKWHMLPALPCRKFRITKRPAIVGWFPISMLCRYVSHRRYRCLRILALTMCNPLLTRCSCLNETIGMSLPMPVISSPLKTMCWYTAITARRTYMPMRGDLPRN